jgi:hypothetical protein
VCGQFTHQRIPYYDEFMLMRVVSDLSQKVLHRFRAMERYGFDVDCSFQIVTSLQFLFVLIEAEIPSHSNWYWLQICLMPNSNSFAKIATAS